MRTSTLQHGLNKRDVEFNHSMQTNLIQSESHFLKKI